MNTLGPNLFITANYIEAAFWIIIGLAFLLAATRPTPRQNLCFPASVAFITFGLSDIVETRTGAWWRPWWLLIWKAACIAALLALAWFYWRQRSRKNRTT